MKFKVVALLMLVSLMITLCAGCTSDVSMPYSSQDYMNGEWTIQELEKHFKELGFTEIEVTGNTTKIIGVYAEDKDSLFGSFEKGDIIPTSRKIWINTDFEMITVETCPEFAFFVENGIDSPKNADAWTLFLEEHEGDLIEFDGTITDWYDEVFWVSISFSIAIEDSEHMNFSQSNVELIDLGMTGKYHYNNYYAGLISEGMHAHVVVSVAKKENSWNLELESIEIIE